MKKLELTKRISLALTIGASSAALAVDDHTDTLPDAKPGQCFAKVMVPAEYKNETSTIVVKEASEKVTVTPAKYGTDEERILVAEASTKLVPIPAVWDTETQTIEISPATTSWVSGSLSSKIGVNPELLKAAVAGGVKLESAEVGACFHEHYQAPKFETKTERVLVSQASEKVTVVPAEYGMVDERVLVQPASKELVEIPAVYEVIEEEVLIEPAKSEWKTGRGLIEKIDGSTGEIMCLVEVPAKYKTVKKRIVKAPASTKVVEIEAKYEMVQVRKLLNKSKEVREAIPEQYAEVEKQVQIAGEAYIWHPVQTQGDFGPKTNNVICKKNVAAVNKTVTRKIVKTAATFQKVEVPAKYENRKVRTLISNASEKRVKIPEETASVTKRVKVSNARLEWQSVLCETNMSKDVVAQVQSALNKAGYDAGSADGVIGRQTLVAVDEFQRKKGLSTGGLTMEVITALGVTL